MPRLPIKQAPGIAAPSPKTLNLIFVYNPHLLSHVDIEVISGKITALAPEIRILGVGTADTADVLRKEDWSRPTLTVSFGSAGRFIPLRGPLFENRVVSKLDQFRRLREAGVRTPLTAIYTPGMALDPEQWGSFVILKPLDPQLTSSGKYLQVFRTRALSGRLLGAEHPSHQIRMLVQSFIDTGEHMTSHRCLTLFGAVLYANKSTSSRPRASLDAPDGEIESMAAEPVRAEMRIDPCEDADLLAFAGRMAAAFPKHPILGCDILREAGTGHLHAIEINGGGNVWHFSSPRNARWRSVERTENMKRRFSSFDVAAEVLVRKTRAEAR